MNKNYYRKYIDFETKRRADMSEIFENPKVFSNLINDMVALFNGIKIDKVIGMDAFGFILASPIALKLKKPLTLARKGGKLPGLKKDISKISIIDYQCNKIIEIPKKSIKKGDRVLIIDEWIKTGGQMAGVIKLIEKLGGRVVGIGTINADENKGARKLFNKYNLKSII